MSAFYNNEHNFLQGGMTTRRRTYQAEAQPSKRKRKRKSTKRKRTSQTKAKRKRVKRTSQTKAKRKRSKRKRSKRKLKPCGEGRKRSRKTKRCGSSLKTRKDYKTLAGYRRAVVAGRAKGNAKLYVYNKKRKKYVSKTKSKRASERPNAYFRQLAKARAQELEEFMYKGNLYYAVERPNGMVVYKKDK